MDAALEFVLVWVLLCILINAVLTVINVKLYTEIIKYQVLDPTRGKNG